MRGSHSVSILQGTEKECYVTGRTDKLHRHHIYYGNGRRAVSDKYGFWVWLIPELHNTTDSGIHRGNKALDLEIKQDCQREFEKTHSREEFMKLIGKNYL